MTDGLFPGPLAPMPEASTAMLVWPSSPAPAPPRFVDGIDAFVAFAHGAGADPAALAVDLAALLTFVAAHPAVLDDPEVAEATARFLGNAIAVAHPAATWRMTDEAEVGTETRSIPVSELLRIMIEQPEQHEPFLAHFATWEQDDLDDAEMSALVGDEIVPVLTLPAAPFRMPELPPQEFLDDDGLVIAYGARWQGSPPDEAYSRVTHPERFAPLRLVVDALVAHLEASYVVEVERRTQDDGGSVVRLRPSTGAAITLTESDGIVQIEGGALLRESAPFCTCDACDQAVETEAEGLAQTVLAIAGGGLRELYPVGAREWAHTSLRTPDGGGRSGGGPISPLVEDPGESTVDMLRSLTDGWWPAWTLRPTDAS